MPDTRTEILAVQTLLPPIRHEPDDVEAAFMAWLSGQPRELQAKAKRILRGAAVEGRHSFLTLDEIFRPCSLTESTRRYREQAVELGGEVLARGLADAGVEPADVDILVTTSCTGYMIPSVDAYLAERLGMRPDVLRLPVTEMGCAAGASALMYASQLLQGRGGGIAAAVNIEFPTNTMQVTDYTLDNIVSTALFSDGLGCTVLRHGPPRGRVAIRDWRTHQVAASMHVLGYVLTDTGYRMELDPKLPDLIAEHFCAATGALLRPHGLSLDDIAHFVMHPGGVKILDRLQELLEPHGGSVQRSRDVMRRCGNMSSATVTFILESLLSDDPAPGLALLMSFGPGFGAHQLLLELEGPRGTAE